MACGALATLAFPPLAAYGAAPTAYDNGVQLAPQEQCTNEALLELSQCPSSHEREAIRSRKVELVSFGKLHLSSPTIGEAICTVNAAGSIWNEREHGTVSAPLRAYGLVESWGAPVCEDHELIEVVEQTVTGSRHKPLSVFGTAELPLVLETTEGSVCDEAELTKSPPVTEPEACPNASERETLNLIESVRRRTANLPWKAELVRGLSRSNAEVPRLRLGMATFGECGPGSAEGTPLCDPSAGEASELPSKCYPASRSYLKVPQGCVEFNLIVPQIPLEIPFYGAAEITVSDGVKNGLFATKAELEETGDGVFVSQSGGHGRFDGVQAIVGSQSMELVTAK